MFSHHHAAEQPQNVQTTVVTTTTQQQPLLMQMGEALLPKSHVGQMVSAMPVSSSTSSYLQHMPQSMMGPGPDMQYGQAMAQLLGHSNAHFLPLAISTVQQAGVPNILGQNGAMTTLQIMNKLPQLKNQSRLEQIMRFLAAHGIFREVSHSGVPAFELTPTSQLLRTDVMNQPRLGGLFTQHNRTFYNALNYFPDILGQKHDLGLFAMANKGKTLHSVFEENRLMAHDYQEMNTQIALDLIPHILNVYAAGWAELNNRDAVLLDMGGNQGFVPSAVHKVYPRIKAYSYDTVYFVDLNKQHPVEGVEFLAGNFIDRATIPPSDATIICNPAFNQQDAIVLPMMAALYNRLNVSGKVIHVVQALPEAGQNSSDAIGAHSLSMNSFISGGVMRSLSQWRQIYQQTGLHMQEIFQLQDALRSYVIISQKI